MTAADNSQETGLKRAVYLLGLDEAALAAASAPPSLQTLSGKRLTHAGRAAGLEPASPECSRAEHAERLWQHLRHCQAEITEAGAVERAMASSPAGEAASLAERAGQPGFDLPGSYGVDRVTAASVDPQRLYVYWELHEESVASAQSALGPEPADVDRRPRLVLRIYDTTGRTFGGDGNNAHGFFDQPVDALQGQWFFDIDRPGGQAHLEAGLLSPDGRFEPIARSRRVDFPRSGPAAPGSATWLTVRPPAATAADSVREREARGASGVELAAGSPAPRGDPPAAGASAVAHATPQRTETTGNSGSGATAEEGLEPRGGGSEVRLHPGAPESDRS